MASEFTLTTGKFAPKIKGGPRAGVGCKGIAKRVGDGAITIQIIRGDGAPLEAYTVEIRSREYAALDGVQIPIELADLDLALPNDAERSYLMRVVADGGATLSVTEALIATEPYSVAGVGPSV